MCENMPAIYIFAGQIYLLDAEVLLICMLMFAAGYIIKYLCNFITV